mmetsp:Transcript_37464/g.85785  ORF Transcript_37464/g.85785 Transcript_37464/m.85785 type:complete len:501 (-) Transcript_37464:615-2117(-)
MAHEYRSRHRPLHQREISTSEDSLCLFERLHLLCPRSLPGFIVLHQPVACGVQIHHVLSSLLRIRMGLRTAFLGVNQIRTGVRQRRLLLSASTDIRGSLRSAVSHQLFVICLGILFLQFVAVHLQLQLILDLVDHADHTASRATLFAGTLTESSWRLITSMGSDLHEAVSLIRTLLIRELLLRGLLVLLRVVELVQTILGKLEQFQSRVVLRRSGHILLMLRLPLLGSFCDSLVKGLDIGVDISNLTLEGVDGLFVGSNVRVLTLNLVTQRLLLVLGFVNFGFAVLALGIVVGLLLLEGLHHLFDQLGHLLEPNLLARQRQSDQVEMGVVVPRSSAADEGQRAGSGGLRRGLHLQQRAGGERLLEQLQGIIAVKHLDSVGQSHKLLSPGLLDLIVLLRLFIAVFVELRRVALIRLQRGLGLIQIILHGGDFHGQITSALSLLLDRTLRRGDFLVLGSDKTVEVAHGLIFVVGDLIQPLHHLVLHCLQNADDLPGHGGAFR